MNATRARNEDLKRALEALRNGVPNRDAVQFLGCNQGAVEARFNEQIERVEPTLREDRQSRGMLVSGGFGAGKSHLLEYLQHLALERNFICSRIVISKETPLYDPVKLFEAAAEAAVMPRASGRAIIELATQIKQDSAPYAEFFKWANDERSGIAPLFPATMLLHERSANDLELLDKISGFWSGERLAIADVRSGLRQIGQSATFTVRAVPVKQLAPQRFRFAARLARAAGYGGWVILIDEVELIGRYSLLQRARSYSELASMLGVAESDQYPGITTVAAITDFFAADVLHSKGDADLAAPRLRLRDTDESRALASRAEAGMRVIQRDAVQLEPPDRAMLDHTYGMLKDVHAAAYDWAPPDVSSPEQSKTRAMRSYVRRWINEWDLKRLYPGEAIATQEEDLRLDIVTETPELEQPAEESAEPSAE